MSNTKIKALIIDDEADGRDIITLLLSQYFHAISIVGTAQNVVEGLDQIEVLKPDLVFLDIEMPDGNAFDILSLHSESSKYFILVTAHEEYALRALKACVVDYLLKPLNREEFGSAVNKVITRINKAPSIDFSTLLNAVQKQVVTRKIRIATMQGFILADIDDVIRCEAAGNYTVIFFVNGTEITACRSLGEYEDDLRGYGFVRVHNKHVVNINQIVEYNKGGKGGGYIIMKGRKILEVSSRRKADLLSSLK